ncbi:MAG: hypothetical protein JW941_07830 [Candidatus Coatesbacteria bacterium]|nr:hypothetical protein [Candidatus Coatesbacteria bacterium]
MAEFTVTITEVASYAARQHIARIIASSPGFFYGEKEAMEILGTLPLKLTFETEQKKGEETLTALHKAGCELSYAVRNSETGDNRSGDLSVCNPIPRFGLEKHFTDEQLERYEKRFNRIPKILWSIVVWSALTLWIGSFIAPSMAVISSYPALLMAFVFPALAAISVRGTEGYALAVVASMIGVLASALVVGCYLLVGLFGPSDFGLFVASIMVCIMCFHLFCTLMHRPIKEWFN